MERFWSKVKKKGSFDCWDWIGAKDDQGYGMFKFIYSTKRAHVVSWIMAHGDIPSNLLCLHRCENPSCVNPAHLYLGNHTDNARDREANERNKNRTGGKYIKFYDEDVDNIKHLYKAGISITVLSKMYLCVYSTIWKVLNHKNFTTKGSCINGTFCRYRNQRSFQLQN